MIVASKSGPKAEFENLLKATVKNLLGNIQVGATLTNTTFEDSVVKEMCLSAKGTSFEGKIEQSSQFAFPDIIIDNFYGLEVKQTESSRFNSTGNSIFEGTRHPSVKDIYLMMCKKGGGVDIRWAPYEDTLIDIGVTHSPRYLISLEDDSESLFRKLDISYDEFNALGMEEKMKVVRELCKEGKKNLWWF